MTLAIHNCPNQFEIQQAILSNNCMLVHNIRAAIVNLSIK